MCVLCNEKSNQFIIAMMESDTNVVVDAKLLLSTALEGATDSVDAKLLLSTALDDAADSVDAKLLLSTALEGATDSVDAKLLLSTALDGATDSVCKASVEDDQTLKNVISNVSCQPITSEPSLLAFNIPRFELSETDAGSNSDQFVNNPAAGHSTDDLVTAADEGFNEEKEKALPSERSDDIAGSDQSSGICSPNDMTPNSVEERCHITVIDVQSAEEKIDCEEMSELHCSVARVKSPISNKRLCDTPQTDVWSTSRHNNVFELPFLLKLEKPDSSFSCDDAKQSSAVSSVSERVASASVAETKYSWECGATNVSVHSLMSDERDFHSENVFGIQHCQPIVITPVTSTGVEQDDSSDMVRFFGVSIHKDLQYDAKLLGQAYVKLVNCANLLLLTNPSVVSDSAVEEKSPKMLTSVNVSPAKSISPSKHSKELGATSLVEQVVYSQGSDATSLHEDTDSHSDRGRKKRQRRLKKAPETKARKSQSKSPRRIVFSKCKTSRKRSHDGDAEDEVICKLDTWKKLHKSKAKADKQSSVNSSPSLAAHELPVKHEPVDNFDGLSVPSEYRFASVSGDSTRTLIKTELVSDAIVCTASQSGDQVPPLPLVDPKTEAKDFSFAVVKQEPADDYLYTENCATGNIDTDCITPLFPIDDVVSLASVQILVSGVCYSLGEILQDEYWQPSVALKRFPIWILQNLQSSSEGLYADGTEINQPQFEEVVDSSWDSSFVTQGSVQVGVNEFVPFNVTSGYNSESDSRTLKPEENAVPLPFKQVSLSNDHESSLKIDALPSECIVRPSPKRLKPGPASKVRGPKSKKVKGRQKKENEEESGSTLSESVCKSTTEALTEHENTEIPRRIVRPRKSSRIKPQIPETLHSEKPLEKENAGKISDKEKSGEISSDETMGKISDVPAVEKKPKNEHKDDVSKEECIEPVRRRGRPKKESTVSKKPVENVPNVVDRRRLPRGKVDENVPTSVKEKARTGEQKKSKPKLGFVIPKKKAPDPNALTSGATTQASVNPNRVPSAVFTLPRIPKLSKALSEEDKERSVLAKLDTEVGKREALKWNSGSSWTSTTSGTLNGSAAGVGSQDKQQQEEKWQRTVVERFRLQNLRGPETQHLGPQHRQPKIPLLGLAPGISASGSEWNRCPDAVNREWINSYYLSMGQPQNCMSGSFPLQPTQRMEEQWPIPTVGYSIPVIQSSDRLVNNATGEVQLVKRNCEGERDPTYGSLTELGSMERSEPVLRDVPYVNDRPDEVFSSYGIDDDDDDDDDDNKGTDRLQNGRPCEAVASSSAALSQSLSLLEGAPMADNMDDSIRLFAEAVQEAIEQGDISHEKCDRLVNLYEKLCRDLIADDVIENQRSAEEAGIICDTMNQTIHKELRSIDDLTKNRGTASGFGAASDLLRNFGNAEKCSSRGNGADYGRPKMEDQEKGASRGYRECNKSNASGSYKHNASHTASGVSFNDRTNRSFAILQDDALWRDLLAQGQSPGMSEESLELLRRLLLEAAKRGVYDDQMVNMLNVVCQHIKLEDSKELSLRKEFGSSSAFQHSMRNESVEIPFINEAHHFVENKVVLKTFHSQNNAHGATPISPLLSSTLQSGSYDVHGMTDSESESSFKLSPKRVAEDESATQKREQTKQKQEAFAAKVLDEIRLLEMLVAIQCELAVVACAGALPGATSESSAQPPVGKSAEPIGQTEPGDSADSGMPHVSPFETSKAVELSELSAESSQASVQEAASQPGVEKASSESCEASSIASEPHLCHPSTSNAGDESQDSHSTQKSTKSTKEKDAVIDKKSCDPKAIEEKVISMARNALKPHYHNGAITSEEFKLIMKKAIAKICKSRSTDISQKRITKFMNAYVEKVVQSRK